MHLFFSLLTTACIWFIGLFFQLLSINEAPSVEIISPVKDFALDKDKKFFFKIEVMDKEDGHSRYDEISDNEVFLKVKYLDKTASADNFIKKEAANDRIFQIMKIQSCLNCHSIQQKLSAPSFRDIFKRYGNSPTSIRYLSEKIIKGSKGSWSDSQQMPAHPELKATDAASIAKLILEYGTDKDLELYTGLEGWIKVEEHHLKNKMILIASYLDRGQNGENRLEGKKISQVSIH